MKKINKTICLNMIVKNESHIIRKTLENILLNIPLSYWVISDTGSTDNTKEVISNFFKEKKIPGELVEHEWKDFGYNRTKALESAYNKSDYVFIFDADDSIVGNLNLTNEHLKYDKIDFTFGNAFKYIRPLLVNNKKKWSFIGVLHEYLSCPNIESSTLLEGNYHIDSGRTGNRSQNPDKYFNDAKILKKAFETEITKDYGLACRYAFYCANSYKDAGPNYIDDAMEWYKKCLELDNWTQEKFMSCLNIAQFYNDKKDTNNALKYWLKSNEYDNERIEGIIFACSKLRENGLNLIVNLLYDKYKNYNKNLQNKLFLYDYLYKDHLEYENSVSAYQINDFQSGYECCKKILINQVLRYDLLKSTLTNLFFYSKVLENDKDTLLLFNKVNDFFVNMIQTENCILDSKHVDIWNMLFNKNKNEITKYKKFSHKNIEKPKILLSFTTCKRYDLFRQTINSMLHNWLDLDKVDYWFCVDDNSDEYDRTNMKKLYKWIDYYMKNENEKGHQKSMNIIWNKLNELKPTYWIHIEDDFLFFDKMNYIEEAIKGFQLLKNENVKQILFNMNYAEIIEQYNVKGHISKKNGFALHDHKNDTFNYSNCHYWPHYSFRPSMVCVKSILELGDFTFDGNFCEMHYANKWNSKGYKSAFFEKITNIHIGRLTSERNDDNKLNAYKLNNENQFDCNNNKKIAEKSDKEISYKIKVVNLERRLDRKENTINILNNENVRDYEIIKAIDGKNLTFTPELANLFRENDFGNRCGIIGCALSHYEIWKDLLNDPINDFYMVFEDDFTLVNGYENKINKLKKSLASKEVTFLGYHMINVNREKYKNIYNKESNDVIIESLNKDIYIGGTFNYTINKSGAKKLLDYIENNGIKHGIDYLMKICTNLEIYETQPHLTLSEWVEFIGKETDSDIQHDFESINFEEIENKFLTDNYVFIQKYDQHDNDLYYKHNKNKMSLLNICENDNFAVGFNSLGFFKKMIDIEKLKFSPYFKQTDGLYIKKSYFDLNQELIEKNKKKYKVKLLCNWASCENICKEWSNMCQSGFQWKNIEITWDNIKNPLDNKEIDYFVIINKPFDNTYYDSNKTIIFQMEPWVYDDSKNWGMKTWGQWAEPDENMFLKVFKHKNTLNNVQWHIKKSLNDLSENIICDKLNKISSICSSKNFDEGHVLRNEFINYIIQEDSNIIDLYGKSNYHNFNCEVTPLKDDDKWNGIHQYKYHFACENNNENGYATEKLWDAILSESLCFYWGCPNLENYICSDAFIRLDLNNKEESLAIIKQAIKEDWWSQRIDIIRKVKQQLLNEYGFFPRIQKIIQENEINKNE